MLASCKDPSGTRGGGNGEGGSSGATSPLPNPPPKGEGAPGAPPGSPGSPPLGAAGAPASTSPGQVASAPSPSGGGLGRGDAPDAGASACRLIYGPVQQPFTGPAALTTTDAGIEVVFHKNGVPRAIAVLAAPVASGAAKAAAAAGPKRLGAEPERASRPACALAGPFAYCSDAQGQVHRALRAQAGDPANASAAGAVVAQADMGAVVAAATLGDQPVLGYLAVRTTPEGRTSEAFARLGDLPPVRISESGSGATDVVFAPRGRDSLLAMTIDARRAMSPVHARVLSVQPAARAESSGTHEPAKLGLGPDVVVYVGGGAEHQIHGALGVDAHGAAFALMPTTAPTSGTEGFGLAVIRLDSPPKLDEPAVVSLYPNGFDFAAVAATHGEGRGGAEAPIVVARVRPISADPSSIRMLELGKIDRKNGSFFSFGFVPSTSSVQNVAIVRDQVGAIWIEYTDGGGSWLERRVCP